MNLYISRRDFIKKSITSAAAKSFQPKGIAPKESCRHWSGVGRLSAAFEVKQTDHDVTVLEARTRARGRVQTLRDSFSDGMYAEAGAVSFSDAHDLILKYGTQNFSIYR
jgi:Flavin containing amine oxidoreductase